MAWIQLSALTGSPNHGEISALITHGKIHMNNKSRIRMLRWLAGGALMVFAGLSNAQWVWLDEKGLKQHSDRPPPSSVPEKRILKSPGSVVRAETPEASPAPAAAAPSDKPAPLSTAEREADYRKRAKEKEEQQTKANAEQARKAAKQASCDAARSYKQQLDAGGRLGMVKNGEKVVMDDAERGRQQEVARKMMDDACR